MAYKFHMSVQSCLFFSLSRLKGKLRSPDQVIVDVGAHEWSRFLPELRTDESAWLVLVEPGRKVRGVGGCLGHSA